MTDSPAGRPCVQRRLQARTRHGVVLVLAVAMATSACGTSQVPNSEVTPNQTTSTAAPTASPSAFSGDLASLMMEVPADAHDWSPDSVTAGMTDVDRSAVLWNPAAPNEITGLLKKSGFQRSAYRAWEDAAGNVVIIDLMQFDRPSYDWLEWSADGLNNGNTIASGHIREVDSGKWAEFVSSGGQHQHVVVFGKKTIGVALRVVSPNGNLELLTKLAIDQYNKMP